MGEGGDKHTHKQTDTDINTMTRPGLGAGSSEKEELSFTIRSLSIPLHQGQDLMVVFFTFALN